MRKYQDLVRSIIAILALLINRWASLLAQW